MTRSFPSEMEALEGACAFAEEACRRVGLPWQSALRMRLALEELFTNTVTHGRGSGPGRTITIRIARWRGQASLVYVDTTPPYNPVGPVELPAPTTPLEDLPVGHLGRALVVGVTARAEYRRLRNRNHVILRFSNL